MKKDSFFNEIAHRLKRVRADARLSQTEFAAKFDISQRTLSDYENAARDIPLHILWTVAREYGLHIEWLLGIDPEGDTSVTQTNSDRSIAIGNNAGSVVNENNTEYGPKDLKKEIEFLKSENETLKKLVRSLEKQISYFEERSKDSNID